MPRNGARSSRWCWGGGQQGQPQDLRYPPRPPMPRARPPQPLTASPGAFWSPPASWGLNPRPVPAPAPTPAPTPHPHPHPHPQRLTGLSAPPGPSGHWAPDAAAALGSRCSCGGRGWGSQGLSPRSPTPSPLPPHNHTCRCMHTHEHLHTYALGHRQTCCTHMHVCACTHIRRGTPHTCHTRTCILTPLRVRAHCTALVCAHTQSCTWTGHASSMHVTLALVRISTPTASPADTCLLLCAFVNTQKPILSLVLPSCTGPPRTCSEMGVTQKHLLPRAWAPHGRDPHPAQGAEEALWSCKYVLPKHSHQLG